MRSASGPDPARPTRGQVGPDARSPRPARRWARRRVKPGRSWTEIESPRLDSTGYRRDLQTHSCSTARLPRTASVIERATGTDKEYAIGSSGCEPGPSKSKAAKSPCRPAPPKTREKKQAVDGVGRSKTVRAGGPHWIYAPRRQAFPYAGTPRRSDWRVESICGEGPRRGWRRRLFGFSPTSRSSQLMWTDPTSGSAISPNARIAKDAARTKSEQLGGWEVLDHYLHCGRCGPEWSQLNHTVGLSCLCGK